MAASGGVSEQRVERGKSDGRYSEERRVVQLEDPRRHDRMREFNFLGLSIISSARGPSSPPAYFPLFAFFHCFLSSRTSWLAALASLSLRTACHFSRGTSPSFLPLSDHILKNPLRRPLPRPLSSYSPKPSSVPHI